MIGSEVWADLKSLVLASVDSDGGVVPHLARGLGLEATAALVRSVVRLQLVT
ncbi:MAG: hypothetical protein KGL39_32760 [Patescibacteria group bacterium]|nr:hypothetical protein [Patescibacteria group bacterium]